MSNPIVHLTQILELSCAHHLPKTLPDHKCHRLHGHNYVVTFKISGQVDPADGFVIDYGIMKNWINELHNKYDHRDLNHFLENPTAENFAVQLYLEFSKLMTDGLGDRKRRLKIWLMSVTVQENKRTSAEYNGVRVEDNGYMTSSHGAL